MSAIGSVRLFALALLLAMTTAYAGDIKGDAARGNEVFMSNICPTCHAVTKDDNRLRWRLEVIADCGP